MATCYFWEEKELRVWACPSFLPQSKSPIEVKRKFGGWGKAVGGAAEPDDKGISQVWVLKKERIFRIGLGGGGQFHLVERSVQRRGVSNLKSEASVPVQNGSWPRTGVLSPKEGGDRHCWWYLANHEIELGGESSGKGASEPMEA